MLLFLIGCGSSIINEQKEVLAEDTAEEVTNIEEDEQQEEQEDVQDSDETESPEDTEIVEPSEETEEEEEEEEEEEDTSTSETTLADLTDFSTAGPYAVYETTEMADVSGCMGMNYQVYTPNIESDYLMILGHGFGRGGSSMTDWGSHFASWGFTVLLPTDMCHYNILSGVDPELNAINLTELADIHGGNNRIYTGHSAGGLSSLIATTIDPNAVGLIGLDTTDTGAFPGPPPQLGLDFASSVTVPSFSLIGEPSSCNTENNSIPVFNLISGRNMVRVNGADHCDYEGPTNWACESVCLNSTTPTFSDDEIRPVIRQLATAASMWISGMHDDGEMYWSEDILMELGSNGLIQPL